LRLWSAASGTDELKLKLKSNGRPENRLKETLINAEKAQCMKPASSPDGGCSAFRPAQAEARNDCVFVILSVAEKPASAFQKNKAAFP
jgi:hypothetical protein